MPNWTCEDGTCGPCHDELAGGPPCFIHNEAKPKKRKRKRKIEGDTSSDLVEKTIEDIREKIAMLRTLHSDARPYSFADPSEDQVVAEERKALNIRFFERIHEELPKLLSTTEHLLTIFELLLKTKR